MMQSDNNLICNYSQIKWHSNYGATKFLVWKILFIIIISTLQILIKTNKQKLLTTKHYESSIRWLTMIEIFHVHIRFTRHSTILKSIFTIDFFFFTSNRIWFLPPFFVVVLSRFFLSYIFCLCLISVAIFTFDVWISSKLF